MSKSPPVVRKPIAPGYGPAARVIAQMKSLARDKPSEG